MLNSLTCAFFLLSGLLIAPWVSAETRTACQESDDAHQARVDEPLIIHISLSSASERTPASSPFHFELGVQQGPPWDYDKVGAAQGTALKYSAPSYSGELYPGESVKVEIPWSEVQRFGGTNKVWIWARLRESSDAPMTLELAAFTQPGEHKSIRLRTRGSFSLRGVLLDPAGQPAVGELVGKMKTGKGIYVAARSKSKSDGLFSLNFRQPGTCWVEAISDMGTVTTGPIEVTEERWEDQLALSLVGPGRLHGRVVDTSGQPVAGLELWVQSKRTEEYEQNWRPAASPEESRAQAEVFREIRANFESGGRGRWDRWGTTDSNGHFDFGGMREGEFVVRSRWIALGLDQSLSRIRRVQGSKGKFPWLLTAEPVSSKGPALELIASHAHLVLNIVDQEGEALALKQALDIDGNSAFPEVWPLQPTAFVVQAPSSAAEDRAYYFVNPGKQIGTGQVAFALQAESDYFVALLQPGAPAILQPLHVPAGATRMELVLRMRPIQEMGSVRIQLTQPDGSPMLGEVDLRILEAQSGVGVIERMRLRSSRKDSRSIWPISIGLPPGNYILRARSSAESYGWHGTFREYRPYGDSMTSFAVEARSETKLTAKFTQAAQIELTLRGKSQPADLAGAEALYQGGFMRAIRDPELRAEHAYALLWPSSGYPIPLRFPIESSQHTSAAGLHLNPLLALGATETSEPIAAGEYTLEVRLLGGRVIEKPVSLIAGETLKLALEF